MDYGEALAQMPVLLYMGTAALGLVIGSFLNVVILRLPRIMEREWRLECAELLGHEGLRRLQGLQGRRWRRGR
jgi:leader peptidase (prepilin peptidase)/N-methyltransferase